jgi:hypothetical protein
MKSISKECAPLFSGLQPDLTLEEVGALLGVSDHTAMIAEKSASEKLRKVFLELGATSMRSFISLDDEYIAKVIQGYQIQERHYSEELGWYAFTRARSINDGTESLKSVASTYAALRVQSANRFKVPLLYRTCRKSAFCNIGSIEAIAMFGSDCLFRSMELKKVLCASQICKLNSIAIVESETGQDQMGLFDIPIILAVLVTAK